MLTTFILPLLLCVICIRYLALILKSPNHSIPGPFLGRLSNLWYLWQMKRGDFHETNIKLHQENGPIIRLAPNYFSISDPSALKPIYGHGTKFTKSSWYDGWASGPDPHKMANVFSDRDTKRHAESRRKLASLYSMSSLVAYEPYVDNCVRIFKERLDGFVEEGKMVDMTHWVQCYAFDVIGEITFGSRFGFLDKGEDVGNVMSTIDSILTFSSYSGLYLSLRPWIMKLFALLGFDHSYIRKWTFQKVQEAKAAGASLKQSQPQSSPDQPAHFAMKLVQAELDKPGYITDHEIMLAGTANVFAGSDTTSIGLSSALFHMYRTPGCVERVRKEMQEVGVSEQPTFREAQALVYLQAAIKESMRVHPGTGFPLFRTVPKGGAVLAGQYFPEGTDVGVNSWVTHNDTSIYGPDAAIFRPERWLEAEPDQLKLMDANFMPFGLGSRTCQGKNISLLEMSKLIPVMVRDYNLVFSDEIGEKLGVMNRWFVKPTNFYVRVRRAV